VALLLALGPVPALGAPDVPAAVDTSTAPTPPARPAAKPVVQRVTPASGPTRGGFRVVLQGTGFTGVKRVLVGTGRATAVRVVSPRRITVAAPAHAAGSARIRVVTDHGSSKATATAAVTYLAPDPPPPPPPPPPAASLTSATPGAGPGAGGTTVTLSGTALTGASAVRFGGTAAASYRVLSDSRISATTPARPVGPVNVTVTTPQGTAVLEDGFTYAAPPTLDHVSPSSGPVAGATATLHGSGLTSDLAVSFGGVPATEVRAAGDGLSLVVQAPPHPPGPVDVAVSGAGGTASLTGGYRYVGGPDLVAVAPAAGPTAGGTAITLTGTGFTGDTVVLFGTKPSLAVSADLAGTRLTAELPARTLPGAVDVTVATEGGSDVLADAFTYVVAPTLTSVAPAVGPASGGTLVTLTGTGFRLGTVVAFGGAPATVVDVTATTATVTAPPHAPGPVDVVVTTPGGATALPDAFTYVAAPTLTAVAPDAGPASGGAAVELRGTGFRAGMSVTFDGVAAVVTAVSATAATVTTPAHPAGPVTVGVTTPGGAADLADAYTYVVAPVLTSLTPTEGPAGGGTTVTLTGSGFAPGMTVAFGGRAAAVGAVTATSATVTAPVHEPGAVDVSVSTAGGRATLAAAYRYLEGPTVTAATPDTGPTTGGTTVTLTGSGLRPGVQVRFGGVLATLVSVAPDGTAATVTAPAHPAGVVDVFVGTAGGGGSLPGGYEYVAPPLLASLSPVVGPASGGQAVTLTGGGFRPGMLVGFGGTHAVLLSVAPDGSSATVTTPSRAAGTVDVTVTTPGGVATLAAAYTGVAAPTLTGVAPGAGPTNGGQTLTVTGTGFGPDLAVSVGGQPATLTGPPTATEATVTTPPHAAGAVDVVVSNVGGTVTAAAAYTYLEAPTLTSVSPAQGPSAGGATVTVTGTGFLPGMTVAFGGVAGTVVGTPTATSATATTPAHAPGSTDITVVTAGGTATAAAAYTFLDPPHLVAVTPGQGPVLGATEITLQGSGLASVTAVQVDGEAVPFVPVSDTEVTATAPPHAAGAVDVAVTTPAGTDRLVDGFVYTLF
jgi:hypothetical protein